LALLSQRSRWSPAAPRKPPLRLLLLRPPLRPLPLRPLRRLPMPLPRPPLRLPMLLRRPLLLRLRRPLRQTDPPRIWHESPSRP